METGEPCVDDVTIMFHLLCFRLKVSVFLQKNSLLLVNEAISLHLKTRGKFNMADLLLNLVLTYLRLRVFFYIYWNLRSIKFVFLKFLFFNTTVFRLDGLKASTVTTLLLGEIEKTLTFYTFIVVPERFDAPIWLNRFFMI